MAINLTCQLRSWVWCVAGTWYIESRVGGANDVGHNDSNIVLEIIQLLLVWLVECSNWRFLFDNVNWSKLLKVLSFTADEWKQVYETINRTYHCLEFF